MQLERINFFYAFGSMLAVFCKCRHEHNGNDIKHYNSFDCISLKMASLTGAKFHGHQLPHHSVSGVSMRNGKWQSPVFRCLNLRASFLRNWICVFWNWVLVTNLIFFLFKINDICFLWIDLIVIFKFVYPHLLNETLFAIVFVYSIYLNYSKHKIWTKSMSHFKILEHFLCEQYYCQKSETKVHLCRMP